MTTIKKILKRAVQNHTIKSVSKSALKRYEKTFKDLARYDRGEQVKDTVSR